QVAAVLQVAHRVVPTKNPSLCVTHHWPDSLARPAMPTVMPPPAKSPTLTSTQVTPGLHVSHNESVEEAPVDWASHHWPPCNQRPTMSALPSPLKSPTLTSTQVAPVLHVVHLLLVKEFPVDWATHH